MNLAFKLATYILFISTFDNTATIPILSRQQQNAVVDTRKHVSCNLKEDLDNILRSRRQDPIVQPVWTSDQGNDDSDQDYNVKITEEKLEQTEAIRDFIHRIIENGSFAVDLDKGDFKKDGLVSEDESEAELELEADAFEELKFPEESERASESEVEEPGGSLEPEAVIEIDLTPVAPEVPQIPEPEPVPVFKNTPQPITPIKPLKKPKKIESVDSPFLTWIKKTFRNPWGTI